MHKTKFKLEEKALCKSCGNMRPVYSFVCRLEVVSERCLNCRVRHKSSGGNLDDVNDKRKLPSQQN